MHTLLGGCLKATVLSHVDKEGNSALHSAVNSGSEEAVKLCLEYGARIDFQQVQVCALFYMFVANFVYPVHLEVWSKLGQRARIKRICARF